MTRAQSSVGTAKECSKCGTLIVWCKTEKGKSMPCEVEPNPKGDFYLFRRPDKIEALHWKSTHPAVAKAKERKDKLFMSHFKTCRGRQGRTDG